MSLNFTTNPYFDDFDDTKNYHRILFKPGYAVQARELTQLQTQIQDQIAKFGKNIFVNGTVVTGCSRLFENTLQSIKIDPSFGGNAVNMAIFNGATIVGASSGTKALVKLSLDATSTQPKTLLVSITSGSAFSVGENLTISGTAVATIQTGSSLNKSMAFSIDSGVFFVNGMFVYVEPQTIAVDAYSNTSSASVGLVLNESFTSSNTDTSLLDNATGTPNYAAPGADRYHASLTLTAKGLTDSVDGFTEIARIVDGALVVNKTNTVYSAIGNEMAQRTFDEAGNYTVNVWPLHITDAVDGATGFFTAALGPGKGYVQGYEFETISTTPLSVPRARTPSSLISKDVNTNYGNYVNVTNLVGPFVTNKKITELSTAPYTSVELHSVVTASVSGSTYKIGTAQVRFLQQVSGIPGTSAVYAMYLFNITMNSGQKFESVKSIITSTSSADIDASSKVGGSGNTILYGSDSPGLVFPIPNQYVKTVQNGSYSIQRTFTGVSFSGGVAHIDTEDSTENFEGDGVTTGFGGGLTDSIKNKSYHVVITGNLTASSTGLSVGSIISFEDANSRSIVVSSTGSASQAQFNVNDTGFSCTATIIAEVTLTTQSYKTKGLSGYSTAILGTGSASGLNTTYGGKDTLSVSDIYQVYAVYNTGSTNPTAVNVDSNTMVIDWNGVAHTEVTSNYIVDNGQRSEIYDHGNLVLTGTAPTDTNYLLVIYKNFSHSGNGYLAVNSYPVAYEDIPTFIDPSSGVTYNLRDCIDFRPRRADGDTSLTNGQVPDPTSSTGLTTAYQYYLARIDTILATADKNLTVLSGIPAVYPTVPTNIGNSMAIYNLVIPPYTAKVSDIQVEYINNERYTMHDIGGLEKRIANLEYYTQLSLLESQAQGTSITDASNLEKFKNGFAVDAFTSSDIYASSQVDWDKKSWGWWAAWFNGSNTWNSASTNYNNNSIANAADLDFKVAIDPYNQNARATFDVNYHQFTPANPVSTQVTGDIATLSYTETSAINQPLASEYTNINPFNVIRYVGDIQLDPPFDQWVDTSVLPSVNDVVTIQLPDASSLSDTVVTGYYGVHPGMRWATTSTSSTVNTNLVSTSTTTLGTSVVSVQSVPYIRPSTIIGVGTKFKPNARLYPFFDNTSISSYVKPLLVLTVNGATGMFDAANYETLTFNNTSHTGTQTGTASAALFSAPLASDPTKRLLYIFGASVTPSNGQYVVGSSSGVYGQITAVSAVPALGDALVPDEHGNVAFEFDVPANTFATGQRVIRLIDNNTNDMALEESVGQATYTAVGLLQKEQTTLLTTRAVQNQQVTTTTGYYYDPTAESFLVDAGLYPQGMHVTSIDLYFKSADTSVPVTVEIRTTANGYPSSVGTIPFASVTLNAEDVNVSDTATVATNFMFPSPIHLVPGEYAIVVSSNSNQYEVFTATVGSTLLNGTRLIDKQPYIGSLFRSQNASTWTADQNSDLMFNINRASFTSTGTIEFDIEDPASALSYQTLYTNIAAVTPTGTTLTWAAKAYNGSAFDSAWASINLSQNIDYPSLKQIAAAAGIGGTPSLRLQATLTTTNDQVSPFIDTSSVAVVTALNKINNDASGEAGVSAGGTAFARYVSKPINLASGFESTNLNVRVDVNAPAGTSIKCYYRTLPTSATTPITDEYWVLMNLESTAAPSTSNYKFSEYSFFPTGAFDQYGVPQNSPIATRFNAFQIKIVLLSSNTAVTPLLQNLRIIALDT